MRHPRVSVLHKFVYEGPWTLELSVCQPISLVRTMNQFEPSSICLFHSSSRLSEHRDLVLGYRQIMEQQANELFHIRRHSIKGLTFVKLPKQAKQTHSDTLASPLCLLTFFLA